MIAKIATAWPYGNLALEDSKPFLPNLILGPRYYRGIYYLGGETNPTSSFKNSSAPRDRRRGHNSQHYRFVVRLFANLGSPIYYGRLWASFVKTNSGSRSMSADMAVI